MPEEGTADWNHSLSAIEKALSPEEALMSKCHHEAFWCPFSKCAASPVFVQSCLSPHLCADQRSEGERCAHAVELG